MTTALAIRPAEQVLEFRRCTGHCCDPVKLSLSPGDIRRRAQREMHLHGPPGGDLQWCADNLVYLGWRAETWQFLYRCPHFDRHDRRCLIYGSGKRSRMCREHPSKRDPWLTCSHNDCTRRTMVLGAGSYSIRWRFPDLWAEDYDRWHAWESRVCRPEWGPECMPEGAEA
jgi:Fe-S-cluster containining protein